MYGLFTLAELLHDLGMLLYAGPFLAFTILFAVRGRLQGLEAWHLGRLWRAWGAGLGLAMGAWVLGLLMRHYLVVGSFTWGWSTVWEGMTLAAHLVFFALWVWNVRVEVWSLEPLRKLDPKEGVKDPQAYQAATGRLHRDMIVQGVLLLTYVVLDSLLSG